MRWRPAWMLAAVAAILLLTICARIIVSGRQELAAGRQALAEGRLEAAQNHLLQAARWALPALSSDEEAVAELLQLGHRYLEEKKLPQAVAAFDDARGALHSTGWLLPPDSELLATADQGYAHALARWRAERHPETDVAAQEANYLALARSVPAPNPWWSLAMGLAFLGYVGLLVRLALKWDEEPTRRRLAQLFAAALLFAFWAWSLTMI